MKTKQDAYKREFKNWADVQSQFRMTVNEPNEVLFAEYDAEGYEGSAYVVYRNGGKYYTVEGSHCSCYGLEDQWSPEEYDSAELLLAALERQDVRRYGVWERGNGIVIPMLKARLSAKSKLNWQSN